MTTCDELQENINKLSLQLIHAEQRHIETLAKLERLFLAASGYVINHDELPPDKGAIPMRSYLSQMRNAVRDAGVYLSELEEAQNA